MKADQGNSDKWYDIQMMMMMMIIIIIIIIMKFTVPVHSSFFISFPHPLQSQSRLHNSSSTYLTMSIWDT
jgi:hypothetical protein